MPANTSKARVRFLYKRLFRRYGSQHWWPARSAWEMMAGAILTQNTAWSNVEKAIAAMRRSRTLSVRAVARIPRRRLEKLIRPSGYFRQKAKRLQLFARAMMKDRGFYRAACGDVGADLRVRPQSSISGRRGSLPLHVLRDHLLSLHGVGPETADAILLYAGRYPVFVVDAYTRRIGQRIGLFKTDDYYAIQAYFQDRLPREAALYNEFHALLVRLAKEVCTSRKPSCESCPICDLCRFGMRERNC